MTRSTSDRCRHVPEKKKRSSGFILFRKWRSLKIQRKDEEGPILFYLTLPHTAYMIVVSLLYTPFKVPVVVPASVYWRTVSSGFV
jgi:hypothetical protein